MLIKRTAPGLLLVLLALLLAPAAIHAQALPDAPVEQPEAKLKVQMPGASIIDVANYYQQLTGKQLIMDSQLAQGGVPITIVVQDPGVTKKEMIALIESTLALNGYTIVNIDAKNAKILGGTKPVRSEGGVQLYTDPSLMPQGDQIVSFFMPFRYLKAEDALSIFQNYAPFHNPTGNYVAVPSVNALVITDTAPLVRRLIALKEVIDVQGAKTVTEFFQLERADAEKVAEILSKLFEKSDTGAPGQNIAVAPPTQPNGQPAPQGAPGAASSGFVAGMPGKVQVFPDKRTNRVMVVGPESQMPYIRSIVENLDIGVEFDEVLERPLRFVRAGDVLSVLANLLAEGDDKDKASNTNATAGDNGQGGPGSASNSASGTNSDDLSGGSQAQLNVQSENSQPQSLIVGSSRLIADRSVNKIIVIGPPEARAKASRVLEMLDQRPKQVYLACIIGQLTLGDDIDFGIDYLMKFGDVRILGQGQTSTIRNVLVNRNASLDIVPGTTDAVNTAASAASTAIPVLSGLTVFGAIGDSVDIFARALATTNRFQIISRPMIYTSNGQIAKISSGQDVPYAGSTLSDVNSNANVNNATTTLNTSTEFKKVRLQLAVRPLINSDKEVTLNISQINDTVAGTAEISTGTTAPLVATQSLDTTVTVQNRQTIVIGGLISDEETRNVTGIPFLKDIPGLGYFFSSTQKKKTRRELIVLIQPFIIGNDVDLKQANYIERANTSFKEGLFDKPVPVEKATLPTPEEITRQSR